MEKDENDINDERMERLYTQNLIKEMLIYLGLTKSSAIVITN